jgi:two-component system, sensor histidine kinase FlrB
MPNQLAEAFALFYEESKKLELQQSDLQEKINQLTQELYDSNHRLAILLNAIPAGVVLLESNLVSLYNPSVLKFLPEITIGQELALPPDWQASIAPNEYLIEGPKGRVTIQLVRIDEGTRSIVQIQDITANIQLHQQSQQENRLAAMGKMAASIAHQFRTPLATALLYSSHLCDGKITGDDAKEFAERLRKQLLGLEKLSQDMLRFITNRPRKSEHLSIHNLIQTAEQGIRPLCEKKGVQFIADIDLPKDQLANVEQQAIVNALLAILENALAVSLPGQQIHIRASSKMQHVTILIDDQGPGIPKALMDSLFEPFSTGHSNGTGLGLAIAKNALEAHRGSIQAENLAQGGARFTITLPCISSL